MTESRAIEDARRKVSAAMKHLNKASRAVDRDDSYVTRTKLQRAEEVWFAAAREADAAGITVKMEWDH